MAGKQHARAVRGMAEHVAPSRAQPAPGAGEHRSAGSKLDEKLRRFLPILFLLLCAICAPNWPRSFVDRNLPSDFSVFWAVAKLGLDHPELIYNDAAVTLNQVVAIGPIQGVRPWAYPPSALLPLLPFGALPYVAALMLFVLSSLSLYLASTRRLFERRKLLALGLVALSQPVIFAALNGQLIILVAALVIAALASLPKAPVRAGILFGLAAAIKPQMLLFAPLALLADRQYRALGVSLGAGGGMILLSLAFGPERWVEWLVALARFKDTVFALDILYRNITPTGILWFLEVTGPAQIIANLLFAAAGGWIVWRVFRLSDDVPTRLVALVGGALCAAPYAMNYDLVLLVPAAAAYLVRGNDPRASLFPMLTGGLLLVSDGLWTPAATMLFIAVTVKPYAWPVRSGLRIGSRIALPPAAAPAVP